MHTQPVDSRVAAMIPTFTYDEVSRTDVRRGVLIAGVPMIVAVLLVMVGPAADIAGSQSFEPEASRLLATNLWRLGGRNGLTACAA